MVNVLLVPGIGLVTYCALLCLYPPKLTLLRRSQSHPLTQPLRSSLITVNNGVWLVLSFTRTGLCEKDFSKLWLLMLIVIFVNWIVELFAGDNWGQCGLKEMFCFLQLNGLFCCFHFRITCMMLMPLCAVAFFRFGSRSSARRWQMFLLSCQWTVISFMAGGTDANNYVIFPWTPLFSCQPAIWQ